MQNGMERLREAARHGFTRVVLPKANMPKKAPAGVETIAVQRLAEALDILA